MEPTDDLKIPEDILQKLRNPDELRRHIENGDSLQTILGYSDKLMEQMYQAAKDVFTEKRYSEAQEAFLFLTTLNPYVYAYWLGLAMSYQLIEEYEQAILAYDCASKVEPETPLPYYYKAGCHNLLNEIDAAKVVIEQAFERAKDNPNYEELFLKIQHAKSQILKRK